VESSLIRTTSGVADPNLMRHTADLAIDYLAGLTTRRVGAVADRRQLLATLGGPLPEDGASTTDVIDSLASAVAAGLVGSAGPRYFGFVIGGSLPAALAADWLTSTWDQNAAVFACSPAASVVEEVVGDWLVELLGLPTGTSVGFTTGGQMAHMTCLAAARHAVLGHGGWDVEQEGLSGAPAISVVVGAEAHATIATALGYLGIGRSRATVVETDDQGRVRLDSLAAALPTGDTPVIVCLQVGNINTGSSDPMAQAIELIRATCPNAWIHVDGVFGLWAAVSSTYRHLIAGYDGADSWATDGHKWLNVPYDSGFAFVRDPAPHLAAMTPVKASYIVYGEREREEFHWVPEYSRRARGFAAYAALRSLGRRGVIDQIERCCRHAARMAAALRAGGPRVEVINDVVLDQVLVRFWPPDTGTGVRPEAAAVDAWTREVIQRVQDDGTCWLAGSTWHDQAVMRISIVNWSTTDDDIDRSAAAILAAARGSDGGPVRGRAGGQV
jgi:glutamate/tyrosine decarboxylase-like PLP-dependent enzyme